MFKKDLSAAPKQKLKSSIQRSLRQSLLSTYPLLTPHIDEIMPKKASLESMKLPDRNTLYVCESQPIFYQQDTEGLLPHLKLVHRFPEAFPSLRIDRGAIRFVLSGATLMAPGLTSKGGRLPMDDDDPRKRRRRNPPNTSAEAAAADGDDDDDDDEEEEEGGAQRQGGFREDGNWSRELAKGEPVVIMAEGKQEACAVGVLVAGTDEVKKKGKGPVVEDAHFLGDGLWRLGTD